MGRQKTIRLVLFAYMVAASAWSNAKSLEKSDAHKGAHPQAETDKALPASPVQLVDGTKPEVAFTWRELGSGSGIISIWNSSEQLQDVTAEVTDFDLSPGSVGAGKSTVRIAISPNKTALPAYGMGRFTLSVQDSATIPRVRGSYGGVLVVKSCGGKFAPFVSVRSRPC